MVSEKFARRERTPGSPYEADNYYEKRKIIDNIMYWYDLHCPKNLHSRSAKAKKEKLNKYFRTHLNNNLFRTYNTVDDDDAILVSLDIEDLRDFEKRLGIDFDSAFERGGLDFDESEKFNTSRNRINESSISAGDFEYFKYAGSKKWLKEFIHKAVDEFCEGRWIPTRDEIKDYLISNKKFTANCYSSVIGDDVDSEAVVPLPDICETILNLCSKYMDYDMRESAKRTKKLSIGEKFVGDSDTDEVLYGFYIFKSARKEYFFVSNAKAKTTKIVDAILEYVFNAATLDRLKKDENTYNYYAKAIAPAKLTFSHSARWGDWADIEGTKSQFQVSISERDTDKELDIVDGLV